jgi:hypothetical protein
MSNNIIIIKLDNVHKEEQKTLKKYLEYNCWDWKETNNEINYNPKSIYGSDGRKKVYEKGDK